MSNVERVAPRTKAIMINSRVLAFVTEFIITKYSRMANRKKINAVKASARFKEKIDDPREARVRRMIGKSKGVLRNLILPSIIVFTPKRRTLKLTVAHRRICFGSIKGSVVVLKKAKGKKNKNAPSINILVFSRQFMI